MAKRSDEGIPTLSPAEDLADDLKRRAQASQRARCRGPQGWPRVGLEGAKILAMGTTGRWIEWHLTPRGWQMGGSRAEKSITPFEPPGDCAGTWLSEKVGANWLVTCAWRGPDETLILALLAKYGPCPHVR